MESVSSKSWTRGLKSTGKSGMDGAVEGRIVDGLVKRLSGPLCADAALVVQLRPPRESTWTSTLSADIVTCCS